jgi:TonB family protein
MRCKAYAIGWTAFLLFSGLVLICAQVQPSQETGSSMKETENKVFRKSHGVSAPRVIYSPDPEYSEKARKVGYQGTCVLWLVVDAKGVPQDIRVARTVGMGLDEKAVEAVRKWRFTPAMKDGAPVRTQINVEVSFHLYNIPDVLKKADAGDAKAQFEASQAFFSAPHPLGMSLGDSPISRKPQSRACPRLSSRWESICRPAGTIW